MAEQKLSGKVAFNSRIWLILGKRVWRLGLRNEFKPSLCPLKYQCHSHRIH